MGVKEATTIFCLFVGYSCYNFNRKTFISSMPVLEDEGMMTKSEMGLCASGFALAYGVSKFVSGILSDRMNGREQFTLGLGLTGMINILFSQSDYFWMWWSLWLLNGLFSGFGWPAVSKILRTSFAPTERGWWWSVVSTSGNVGPIFFPFLARGIELHCVPGWRGTFAVMGGFTTVIALLVYLTLPDFPSTTPPSSPCKSSSGAEPASGSSSGFGLTGVVEAFRETCRYPLFVRSVLIYIPLYFARTATGNWLQLFLINRGISAEIAAEALSAHEVGGVVGSLSAGALGDLAIKYLHAAAVASATASAAASASAAAAGLATRAGSEAGQEVGGGVKSGVREKPNPAGSSTPPQSVMEPGRELRVYARFAVMCGYVVYLIAALAVAGLFLDGSSPPHHVWGVAGCVGMAVFGPVSMFGLLVVESVPVEVSGMAGAVVGFASQGGGVLAGYPFALLVDWAGWSAFVWLLQLLAGSACAAMLGLCFQANFGTNKPPYCTLGTASHHHPNNKSKQE